MKTMLRLLSALATLIITLVNDSHNLPLKDDLLELSIIHINDFHARFEETSLDSGLCKTKTCIGGFSRLYTAVMALKQNPNSILLNAGDNFEGTLWYNVHKWNVTQHFLNKLPTDAFTLGNHEFEDKIDGLVPFLQHLQSPVVVANIDASKEPSLEGLFNKSTVIVRNGVKIGIIGVILSTINQFVDVGELILLGESASVNAEATRLVEEEGVFTNIVLSHCGYDVDQAIAKNATGKIGLIVGGHSHSFLFSGESPPGPDLPVGPYPTVVEDGGNTVLVVQASSYSKYVGNLSVFYDRNGSVVDWKGDPVFLGSEILQDEGINEELMIWKKKVDEQENCVVGRTLVRLGQSRCSMEECLLGNFVTDAMVFGYIPYAEPGAWTGASIALMNVAGLRSGIDVGNITFNEIVAAQPFKNTVDLGELKGRHLKEILETSTDLGSINLLQVSGMHVEYNLTQPKGSRVTSIKLRCRVCDTPVYETLKPDEIYRIILPSFLANGGSGFNLFRDYIQNRKIGPLDIDLIEKYVEARSPIFQEIGGRIMIYTS